jgi:hypothetical protein
MLRQDGNISMGAWYHCRHGSADDSSLQAGCCCVLPVRGKTLKRRVLEGTIARSANRRRPGERPAGGQRDPLDHRKLDGKVKVSRWADSSADGSPYPCAASEVPKQS